MSSLNENHPPATLIITRLLNNPSPESQNLAKKLLAAVDAYECKLCGFQGEPGLILVENPYKILFYCPICSGENTRPDELKNKA
jgi:hypothetical protein